MNIPGPEPRADGGAGAIAAAGGLHTYQLRLHAEYGPVVRFQLPGAELAVSVADPVLLEATAHLDKRPERLFAFLDPLCEAGNLQVLPAEEHAPWRHLLLSVLAGRPSHERHFAQFTALTTALADRWAERADGEPVALQKDLTALSLRMICAFALGGDLATRTASSPRSRRCSPSIWDGCTSRPAVAPGTGVPSGRRRPSPPCGRRWTGWSARIGPATGSTGAI
ncbi:hypothetical protein GCM10010341_52480 [Streptomyces noursei]|nr:cytochrome P450 [Streptomyces noursei]GGX24896.1 hypothetical protein GCM10010341_52480 [Streptomyces noursei]